MAGLKTRAIASIGGGLLTALMRSTRLEIVDGHEVDARYIRGGEPTIFVLWHGRLLPCSYYYRDLGLGTLISRNRDGDYITGVIENWGYKVIRGSSSRGGVGAQRAIVRALGEGVSVALTPDGPRGPRQKMKLGPLRAAQKAGVPIVPVSAGAAAAWFFGRWDRFLVPRPFTWIAVALAPAVQVPPTADERELMEIAKGIEARLDALTKQVDEIARGSHH